MELGSSGHSVSWREPTVYDESGNTTLLYKTHKPGDTFTPGSTTITYLFSDSSSNLAGCSFDVTINTDDTVPPTILSCPSDIDENIEIGNHGDRIYWSTPIATDISGNVSIVSQTHLPGNRFSAGKHIVNYRFTDGNRNEASCSFQVFIQEVDTTAPIIKSCPPDIIKDLELGTKNTTVVWSIPSATDISGNVTLVSQSHIPGSSFVPGKTTVTYKFVDGSNNEAFCTFDILINQVDTFAPTIFDCPSDISTSMELGSSGQIVSWREPSAYDESGNATLLYKTHKPGDTFTLGSTTITYLFSDSSNNLASCSFDVTINTDDTVPPAILSCPSDINENIELGTHSVRIYWSTPIVTDMSGNVSIVAQTHLPGDRFSARKHVVNYRFTDGNGNEASCSFHVVIQEVDTTAPIIKSCPSGISKELEIGTQNTPVNWNIPSATDVSGNVSLASRSHAPGDTFVPGRTTVTYTFVDGSNNEAFCTFDILINQVDTHAPTIFDCPSDISTSMELGSPGHTVSWREPSADDESGNVTLLYKTHKPGGTFAIGSTRITYLFTDNSNNLASCSFEVSANTVDTTPPAIQSCPADINANIELGIESTAIYWTTPIAYDISGNVTLVSYTHSSGNKLSAGNHTVIYRFADGYTNEAFCTFQVSIEQGEFLPIFYVDFDTIPPEVVSCPSDFGRQIELGTHSIPVYWSPPSAIDLSGNISLVSQSHFPGDMFTAGRWTVVYRFTDGSGNEASCAFRILIEEVDTTPPVIDLCPDDIIETIELGATTATVSWTEPQASDLSGNVTMSPRSRIPTTFSPFAETFVRYVFQDASGNKKLCEFFVSFEIVDTTPPDIITCPKDIHTTTEVGTSGMTVSWSKPFAMDHSGVILTRATHEPGQMFPIGSTDVIYIFEDESGNRARCDFTVNVEFVDTLPPEISVCSGDISETIELGDVHKMIYWPEPEAFDNSDNVSLAFRSHYYGDYFKEGRTDVSYVFTDGSGNMASCNFSITLIAVDTKAPEILECPSDIFKTIEAGLFGSIVTWKEPLVTDASGNTTLLVKTHLSGTLFTIGKTSVTYIFVDPSNNMAACTFHIIVDIVDTSPPDIISCPENIYTTAEVGTPGKPVSWSEPFAMDHSGIKQTNSSHDPGQMFLTGSTDVVYSFEDGYGNQDQCTFTVNVESVDTLPPEIKACPNDISETTAIGNVHKRIFWSEPKTFDNSGHVSLAFQSHHSGGYFTVGRTDVSYLFTDGTGNMASCNFSITLLTVDTTAPKILQCPSDIFKTIEAGLLGSIVTWKEPVVTDASGNTTLLVKTHSSGTFFTIGRTSVTYLFVDPSNNMATCNFHIFIDMIGVVGNLPPKIGVCPSDISETIELGDVRKKVYWLEPEAFDKSENVSLAFRSHQYGDYFTVGRTDVSYLFTDGSENIAFCNFSITLITVDTKAPEILECPSDIFKTIEAGLFGSIVIWKEPVVTDASGNTTLLVKTHSSGTSFTTGKTCVTYLFVDPSNNMATCKFHITIDIADTNPPQVLTCPTPIRKMTKTGTLQTPVVWAEPIVIDHSGDVIVNSSHSSGQLFSIGSTQVLYNFTDRSQNQASCQFSVTVEEVDTIPAPNSFDTTPPTVIDCPTNVTFNAAPGSLSSIDWKEPTAEDISGNVERLARTHVPGSYFPVGITTVTYVFKDNANNIASCLFPVIGKTNVLHQGSGQGSLDSQTSSLIGFKYDQMTWIFIAGVTLTGFLSICLILSFICLCKTFRRNKNRSDDTELEDRNQHKPIAVPLDIDTCSTF
ncbi:hyalin-like [Amphiura filiformis]|uniref:hyalin-like n=1 Tax=Amphiura filiformis TaxID=82378 RepID=UPI003B21BDAC